jgi:hypothetical protein
VRLCGTAGWMMGGLLVSSVMLVSGTKRAGAVAAVSIATTLSPFVSVYCLTRPRAPRMAVDTRGVNVAKQRRAGVATGPFGCLITCFGSCPIACFVFQIVSGYSELRGLPRA